MNNSKKGESKSVEDDTKQTEASLLHSGVDIEASFEPTKLLADANDSTNRLQNVDDTSIIKDINFSSNEQQNEEVMIEVQHAVEAKGVLKAIGGPFARLSTCRKLVLCVKLFYFSMVLVQVMITGLETSLTQTVRR